MRQKNRGQRYITLYHTRLRTALMQMCRYEKLDMPGDFRSDFSWFVSGMGMTVAQDTHKSCDKCEVRDPPPVILYIQSNM